MPGGNHRSMAMISIPTAGIPWTPTATEPTVRAQSVQKQVIPSELLVSAGNWVAVQELNLSYHNGYIYIVNNRVSPM